MRENDQIQRATDKIARQYMVSLLPDSRVTRELSVAELRLMGLTVHKAEVIK